MRVEPCSQEARLLIYLIIKAERGLLFVHRSARNHFKFRHRFISCGLTSFPLCSCAVGGRRDLRPQGQTGLAEEAAVPMPMRPPHLAGVQDSRIGSDPCARPPHWTAPAPASPTHRAAGTDLPRRLTAQPGRPFRRAALRLQKARCQPPGRPAREHERSRAGFLRASLNKRETFEQEDGSLKPEARGISRLWGSSSGVGGFSAEMSSGVGGSSAGGWKLETGG